MMSSEHLGPNTPDFFELGDHDVVPPVDKDFTHYHFPDVRLHTQEELRRQPRSESLPGVEVEEIEGEIE